MAGGTQKLIYSLRWRLAVGLSLLVSAMALVAGALSYRTAFQEAHELQDVQLRHIARLLDPHKPVLKQDLDTESDENMVAESTATIPVSDIVVQNINSPRLNLIFGSPIAQHQLQKYAPGFYDFNSGGTSWRVYIHAFHHPDSRVVIAQQTAYRNHIATESARNSMWPLLALIPMVWLFTGWLTHSLFRRLQQLSNEVDQRRENVLSPLPTRSLPSEVRPLVEAINRQFIQIQAAQEHDKRFIANAAHELRTPITALTLQLAQLEHSTDDEAGRRALLAKARSGLQRTQQLLTQLLDMARAQNQHTEPGSGTAMLPLLRGLYTDLLPLAEQKQLDMGVLSTSDYTLAIDPADLRSIFKNLLENAIRYTPKNGRIDVACTTAENTLYIRVSDTGCGVAEAERERIFEPFYRVAGQSENGSGLGLAIVSTLCQKWHIDISVDNTEPPCGLSVCLALPAGLWQPSKAA
ncbi:GHKL domain-containing protein [Paralysiella testudinis]|uniref:histidine kinase n=1 Tax=Paralysiella testudinis TaxID=2809020 RepID=A0A892ZK33_9NEIS|nr:GHKL domain-containing protein [Paralysiella testudinis]